MKKPSPADKKAQKALNDPKFQKDWASHMKSFGPILKDAFAEDPQGRVTLCAALTNITAKKQPQALLKLNSLQKHLVTDADKAAFSLPWACSASMQASMMKWLLSIIRQMTCITVFIFPT